MIVPLPFQQKKEQQKEEEPKFVPLVTHIEIHIPYVYVCIFMMNAEKQQKIELAKYNGIILNEWCTPLSHYILGPPSQL